MGKIIFILIIVIILFAPIFKKPQPSCICFNVGPCSVCENESLWNKLTK